MMDARWQKRLTESSGSLCVIIMMSNAVGCGCWVCNDVRSCVFLCMSAVSQCGRYVHANI